MPCISQDGMVLKGYRAQGPDGATMLVDVERVGSLGDKKWLVNLSQKVVTAPKNSLEFVGHIIDCSVLIPPPLTPHRLESTKSYQSKEEADVSGTSSSPSSSSFFREERQSNSPIQRAEGISPDLKKEISVACGGV